MGCDAPASFCECSLGATSFTVHSFIQRAFSECLGECEVRVSESGKGEQSRERRLLSLPLSLKWHSACIQGSKKLYKHAR